jgi:hypothetical protein
MKVVYNKYAAAPSRRKKSGSSYLFIIFWLAAFLFVLNAIIKKPEKNLYAVKTKNYHALKF